MARFYANENFSRLVVIELRSLGHDVLTIQETGKGGQAVSDPEVLAFSTAERRILLTYNRKDFIRLHSASPAHEGILACTYDPDFVGQAKRIDAAIAANLPIKGKLLRVNRPQK